MVISVIESISQRPQMYGIETYNEFVYFVTGYLMGAGFGSRKDVDGMQKFEDFLRKRFKTDPWASFCSIAKDHIHSIEEFTELYNENKRKHVDGN